MEVQLVGKVQQTIEASKRYKIKKRSFLTSTAEEDSEAEQRVVYRARMVSKEYSACGTVIIVWCLFTRGGLLLLLLSTHYCALQFQT